jgi:hypothetical protein
MSLHRLKDLEVEMLREDGRNSCADHWPVLSVD